LDFSGQILNEVVPEWIQLGDKQQVIIFCLFFVVANYLYEEVNM